MRSRRAGGASDPGIHGVCAGATAEGLGGSGGGQELWDGLELGGEGGWKRERCLPAQPARAFVDVGLRSELGTAGQASAESGSGKKAEL